MGRGEGGGLRMGNTCIPVADSFCYMAKTIQYCKVKKKKPQHSKNKDHGIWSHHFMASRWGNNGNSKSLFSWAPKSLRMVTAMMELKALAPWMKSYDKPRQRIRKKRHHFADKCLYIRSYSFSSSHVQI